jgi:hypothetical protein
MCGANNEVIGPLSVAKTFANRASAGDPRSDPGATSYRPILAIREANNGLLTTVN